MSLLEFDSVTHSYDEEQPSIEHVTVSVVAGQFVSIMGPNGCGKSTILRLATGLLRPRHGRVRWDGENVKGPSVERGFLPQQPRLFNWLPVWENVAFGLKMRGLGRRERRRLADDLLDDLGLRSWSDRYPLELSGGMQARVALAMVLANEPRMICLDESFGALDFQTRLVAMQTLIDVWRRRSLTILVVTHHLSEALLADRVLVFSGRPGKIELDRNVLHYGTCRLGANAPVDLESHAIVESTVRAAALAAFDRERSTLPSRENLGQDSLTRALAPVGPAE